MIGKIIFILTVCGIALGIYTFNWKNEILSSTDLDNNETTSDSTNRSILKTIIEKKEITPELSQTFEKVVTILNNDLPNLQGNLENDLPIIENILKSAPYPNDFPERYLLIIELSKLIIKDQPKKATIKKIMNILKSEILQPGYSEIDTLTTEEKQQRLKIIVTAFELHAQLETNQDISTKEAAEIIRSQKDFQTRTLLTDQFIAMNPNMSENLKKIIEGNYHKDSPPSPHSFTNTK